MALPSGPNSTIHKRGVTMKRAKILTTVCILSLSLTVALAAQAGPFRGGHRGHGPEGGFHPMRALMQLDLAADQKQSIYDILKKYEQDQDKARESMQERRQQMGGLMTAEELDKRQSGGPCNRPRRPWKMPWCLGQKCSPRSGRY